jgi:hypothetical protein
MKVMREIGLNLANAPRRQLVPKLAQNADQIVSFVSSSELPQWLQGDERLIIWQLKDYPAPDLAAVRRQRDEIKERILELIASKMV